MTDRSALLTTGFVLAFLSCSCAGDRPVTWTGTIDTLAGGTVLVANPDGGLWAEGEAWRVLEDLRIGATEGDGPDVFGNIKAFVVDSTGRMYVVDDQAMEVRVFGADGAHQFTIGGPGDGPGEFRALWGLTISPDGQLWALDNGLGRWSIFTTTGTFDRSYRREVRSFDYVWAGGFDAEGNLWEYKPGRAPTLHLMDVGMRRPSSGGDAPQAAELGRVTEAWIDTRVAMFDTVATTTVPEHGSTGLRFDRSDGARMFAQMPFAVRRPWALDPRGYVWFAVSDTYRVYQTGVDGDTLRVITLDRPPEALGPVGRDSILSPIRSNRADGWRSVDLDESTFPETRPLFENLAVDDRGGLWLWQRRDTSSTTYDVFDPEGRYLGDVRVPFPIRRFANPRIVGDRFYAITRDDLDVSYLVRGRIERDEW